MANNRKETFPGFHIEDGFVIGRRWSNGKQVMIGVHAIERIELDCGNSPPADRIYFIDARETPIDLKRVDANGEVPRSASDELERELENA